MPLQELFRDEKLSALLALEEVLLLLCWQLQEVLVGREGLLFQLELLLQSFVFSLMLLDNLAHFGSLFVVLLVVQI